MPKLLPHIRENAILETRKVLSEQGFSALNMRSIAKSCSIAVGTMYNYFPSKEYLTGCVVLEDWVGAYEQMTLIAANADGIGSGLCGIYEKMLQFVLDHQYLSSFDMNQAKGEYTFAERHGVLLRQIEDLLRTLCCRFGCSAEDTIITFLAESILSFSVKHYSYAQIAPAFMKLIY